MNEMANMATDAVRRSVQDHLDKSAPHVLSADQENTLDRWERYLLAAAAGLSMYVSDPDEVARRAAANACCLLDEYERAKVYLFEEGKR